MLKTLITYCRYSLYSKCIMLRLRSSIYPSLYMRVCTGVYRSDFMCTKMGYKQRKDNTLIVYDSKPSLLYVSFLPQCVTLTHWKSRTHLHTQARARTCTYHTNRCKSDCAISMWYPLDVANAASAKQK